MNNNLTEQEALDKISSSEQVVLKDKTIEIQSVIKDQNINLAIERLQNYGYVVEVLPVNEK